MGMRDRMRYNFYDFLCGYPQSQSTDINEIRGRQLLFTVENGTLFCPAFIIPSYTEYFEGISTSITLPVITTEFESPTLLSAFGRERYGEIHKIKTKEGSAIVGSGIIMDEEKNILVLGGTVMKYYPNDGIWINIAQKVIINNSVFNVEGSKLDKFIAREFAAQAGFYNEMGIRRSRMETPVLVSIEDISRFEVNTEPKARLLSNLQDRTKECLLSQLRN